MLIDCDHCGLPIPAGLIEEGVPLQFCCTGCRVAYEVIHEHGLDGYYDIKARIEAPDQAAQPSGKSFAEFDDPAFHELYCRKLSSGLETVELYLEGVHCAACVWLVEKLTVVMGGVAEVRLDLGRSLAGVTWDPKTTTLSQIARFLDSMGYAPHPFRGVEARDMARREERRLLIRIAIAGVVAGNVMLIAFALYGGHFHGISEEFSNFFRWVSLGLSLPSVLWCASIFYRGAWGALRTRTLHMDLPIAVGILAGFIQGTVNTVRGTGEVYFDSVTALIFFLLIGRFLQRRQQRAAASSTELLFSLAPSVARLVEDSGVREVPLEALTQGSRVEVRAGDSVPADGIVVEGASTLDRSLLTGESLPEPVSPGDAIHAGTVNMSGRLFVEVRSTGEDTRVGRLMRLVEEGAMRRAPVVLLADRISGWFVAAVLILAALTVLIWWRLDPEHAIQHAVALLIVSCPCALGLATPLAVSAAIGRAARKKILIKGGDALESLAKPGRILLDKTGTVTEGRQAVVRWWGDTEVRGAVAAIERHSAHPVARALAEAGGEKPLPEVSDVREIPGAGMIGRWGESEVLIASAGHARKTIGELPGRFSDAVNDLAGDGSSPVVVVVDGRAVAVVGIGDPVRGDSAASIGKMIDRGWQVEVLSGDHQLVVDAIAQQIGVDPREARGESTPEEKLEIVRQSETATTTVMVGDGVNDAAALAAATVGIGVHGGAEATLAAADVYLGRPGLSPIVELLDGARRTLGVIRRNLVFSLLYNVIAVTFAITGHMSPIMAAILMPLSSMTVVLSSYRAKTF